jgi:hypothetical protein
MIGHVKNHKLELLVGYDKKSPWEGNLKEEKKSPTYSPYDETPVRKDPH